MKLEPCSSFFNRVLLACALISVTRTQDSVYKPNCEPYYAETSSFMTVLKTIRDYGSNKWATSPPKPEDLPKIIEFWCLKPPESQFKQLFMDKKADFNMSVAFIVHGYFGSIEDSGWLVPTAKAWAKFERRTICIVDWRELAIGSYCNAAKKHVKIVGSYLAEMIQKQNFKPADTILMGHSLGAHVCGVCGHVLKGDIKIIYGLDPAGPQFTFPSIVNASDRLDLMDARHVQCLHTNRGVAGTFFACGDSDYYANFGYRQIGCVSLGCSHVRATYLFEVSLNPQNIFNATECGSDVRAMLKQCNSFFDRLGIHGKHYSGQFYFNTSDCYPYLVLK